MPLSMRYLAAALCLAAVLPRLTASGRGRPVTHAGPGRAHDLTADPLPRLRGGADLWEPRGASRLPAAQQGHLQVLWFRARRVTLKGAAFGLACFALLGKARPPPGSVAAGPGAWLCTRLAASLCLGLIARPIDWKVLVVALALARGMPVLRWTGGVDRPGDMSAWPGGYLRDNRDKYIP